MTITLKHLAGPLSPQEQTFDDSHDRITLGRDAAVCDVVYPPDLTLVGRRHAALVRQLSGDYVVDIFGDHYVAVDGEPCSPMQAIATGATMTLGDRAEGPRFGIEIRPEPATPDLHATRPQERVPSARAFARIARRSSAVALAVAGLSALGLTVATLHLKRNNSEQAAIAAKIGALETEQRKAALERIPVEVRERLARSVLAVVKSDQDGDQTVVGTAWAVRSNMLATNAHVAAVLAELGKGEKLLVREPGSGGESYEVSGVAIHPGYAAFMRFVADDPLLVPVYGGMTPLKTVSGYDVALLRIDRPVPPQMVLTLASPDRLLAITPGQPVAYAGYPYENLVGQAVQPYGRTPQIQVGNVTGLTDFFFLPSTPAQRQLVQHNLPATGGASGSPIVDASGRVIALLSAGNLRVVDGSRLPSAALVNFGQRADAVIDLLSNQAEQRLRGDEPYWRERTAAFKRGGADAVIATAIAEASPAQGYRAALSREIAGSTSASDRIELGDGAPTIRLKVITIAAKPRSEHLVAVFGPADGPVKSLSILSGGRIASRVGVDRVGCAITSIQQGGDDQLTLIVETEDRDTRFTVRDYVWEAPG